MKIHGKNVKPEMVFFRMTQNVQEYSIAGKTEWVRGNKIA